MTKHSNLIILGSGPAGYTAAIYASRANLKAVLITGMDQGGQLVRTHKVDNWPGDVNGVTGQELMERMLEHAKRFDTEVVFDQVAAADLNQRPFRLQGEAEEYTCDALIIATGASAKYLGLPSEEEFKGKGVSACAVCDGFFYKGEDVAVVGGGDTAAEDVLYLAQIAKHVSLIHRRDELSAQAALAKQLLELNDSGKIDIYWNSVVDEVLGDAKGVTGVRIKDNKNDGSQELAIKGLFVAIGHKPNTEIFSGQLEMQHGFIKTKKGMEAGFTETNIPGVFAAGDVADPIYRQAITASATGCMAALDVKKYLKAVKT